MEPADGLHRQVGPFQCCLNTTFMFFCVFCHWWLLFGFCPRGLPTDRPMWSDESGLKECTKGNTHPPSPQWSWVGGLIPTEPALSLYLTNKYLTPPPPQNRVSGVRVGRGLRRPGRDGQRGLAVRCRLPRVRHRRRSTSAQSETSVTSVLLFSNSTFHGHKAMKDFVRRRRWTR